MAHNEVVIVKSKNDIKEVAGLDRIMVWSSEEPLYKVLEESGKTLDRKAKMNMRICRDVKYNEGAVFKTGRASFTVYKLSEVLEKKPVLDTNDRILVNDSEVNKIFETIQQLVNLGYLVDVYSEFEEKARVITDKLISNSSILSKNANEFFVELEAVVQGEDYEELSENIKLIRDNAEGIKQDVLKIGDETIKVAVFSTKKSGKSMLVNALLGEEYAPTSLELATPNIIIYRPHNSRIIKLEYKGEIMEFLNANELREYIKEEFSQINLKGATLNDMIVYYPAKEGINYEIWDTPGPDLAGSEHGKLTERAIENTDVAVFIVDYSKYAQESEIALLSKIKEVFDKQGKKHSLVGVINKIDLMFADANTEHIIPRVSDFIYERFRELGFERFMVIPTTAMVYFYLNKLAEKFPELREAQDFRKAISEIQEGATFYDLSYEIQTYITVVANYTNSLRMTHGKIFTFEDVNNLTNFPVVKKYISYVYESKAKVEKRYAVAKSIELRATTISNEINASKLLLSQEVGIIAEAIKDFEERTKEIGEKFDFAIENVEKSFAEKVKESLTEISKKLGDNFEYFLTGHERFNAFKKMLQEELEEICKEPWDRKDALLNMSELTYEVRATIDGHLNNFISALKPALFDLTQQLNSALNEDHEVFVSAVESLNNKLSDIGIVSQEDGQIFELPKIELKVDLEHVVEEFAERIPKVGEILIPVSDALKERNLLAIILDILFKPIEDVKVYKYTEEALKLKTYELLDVLRDKLNKLRKYIEEELSKLMEQMSSMIKEELDEKKLLVEEYYASVNSAVQNLKSNLHMEKSKKEKLNNMYEKILGSFKGLKRVVDSIMEV